MRVVALLFLPVLALAQQANTTTGQCSPIAPNNSGSITINCQGIPAKLGTQLVEILNRVAKKQLDPDAVMARLDEILRAINPNLPVKTYTCNGIWRSTGPSANSALSISTGAMIQRSSG